jgi:hypothetical protein
MIVRNHSSPTPHKIDQAEHRMTKQIPPRDLKVVGKHKLSPNKICDKTVISEVTQNP